MTYRYRSGAWKNIDLTGQYRRSVAYDRFILGWKTFDRLDREAFTQRD
jgi:hypothetical protein